MPDTTPTLRDRVVQALAAELMPRHGGPQHRTPGGLPLTATAEEVALHRAQPLADAVLAVLPASAPAATADRAAMLRWAADLADQRASSIDAFSSSDYGEEARAVRELASVAAEFRRLADEAQPTAPWPSTTEPATAATEAARCTCADAGPAFAPVGHYADCPHAVTAATEEPQP